MRIIAGEYKGRRLLSPANQDVRPTTDKVKEAVFSMLMPYLNDESICLDLFAGTGNLGLEALSRGAKRCYFSDSARDSIKLVKENIEICKADDKAILLSGDYKNNINRIREKIDIVFLDPPYNDNFYLSALSELKKADILSESACIICEHSDRNQLPLEYEGFVQVKNKKYGSIGVSIYE